MTLKHALGRASHNLDTRRSPVARSNPFTRLARFGARVVGAVLVAATVCGGQAAAAAGKSCAYAEELAAHKLRFVQSQLMVAALRCGGADKKAFQNGYNNFVQKNDAHFKAGAPVLRSYLRRAGLAVLDVYLTELANDMALEAALNPKYCASALQALEDDAAISSKNSSAAGKVASKAVGYNEAFLPVQYMPLASPCATPRPADRALVAVENND